MKKVIIISLICSLYLFASNSKGTITISSPLGGEIIEMHELFPIEWADDFSEDVLIKLYKNTTLIKSFVTASDGNFKWNFHTNDIVAGSDYKLRIESNLDSLTYDETGNFTIKGTNVTGSVSGNWTESNSPYVIVGNANVDTANSLLIDKNVKIRGSENNNIFDIQGKIEAIGEPAEKIEFEDMYLNFDNSSSLDSSKIKYSLLSQTNSSNLFTSNKTFGGGASDYGRSVHQTTDGGFITAGYTTSYGAGDYDIWLIKTDSTGTEEWNKTYGGAGSDRCRSVQQTSDGGFIIVGYTTSYGLGSYDGWLIKTDSSGNVEWDETYGDSFANMPFSVQQTSDGGYVLLGITYFEGETYPDIWFVKTDPAGLLVWSKTFGGSGIDEGYEVKQTSDGGYIIIAATTTYGAGNFDMWLIKTTGDGTVQWDNTFGGSGEDYGHSVDQTFDGGFVLTGYTYSYGAGGSDVWLVKTDPVGDEEWNNTFGGTSYDIGYSVLQTEDCGYIISGEKEVPGNLKDLFLVKADINGDEEWSKTFGSTGDETGYSLDCTSDGGYIACGITLSFGAGGTDFWLVKTDAYGNNTYDQAMTVSNNSKVVLQNSQIKNIGFNYGLIVDNAAPVISNNLIVNNFNGIKFTNSSSQYIVNNTIGYNENLGLYFDGNSDAQLINNLIGFNGGFSIYINSDDSDPDFYYNDIQNGSAGFGLNTGVVFSGDYSSNIDEDPLFTADTYQFEGNSPCAGSGYPGLTEGLLGFLYIPQTDIIGNPRLVGDLDMGCYEAVVGGIIPAIPNNIVTTVTGNSMTIDWDVVPNANSYLVYTAADPYGVFDHIATVSDNSYFVSLDPETKKFFYIVASSDVLKEGEDVAPVLKKIKIEKIEEMLR